MLTTVVVLLRSIGLICGGHRAVVLENLALRQQLATLTRTRPRPQLRVRDRLFWIALARAWRGWRTALVVAHPDTVVRWHRQWLRRRWTRRSAQTRSGRPSTAAAIRRLVNRMGATNPLWGAPRIHGELGKLGIDVSERARIGIPGPPICGRRPGTTRRRRPRPSNLPTTRRRALRTRSFLSDERSRFSRATNEAQRGAGDRCRGDAGWLFIQGPRVLRPSESPTAATPDRAASGAADRATLVKRKVADPDHVKSSTSGAAQCGRIGPAPLGERVPRQNSIRRARG